MSNDRFSDLSDYQSQRVPCLKSFNFALNHFSKELAAYFNSVLNISEIAILLFLAQTASAQSFNSNNVFLSFKLFAHELARASQPFKRMSKTTLNNYAINMQIWMKYKNDDIRNRKHFFYFRDQSIVGQFQQFFQNQYMLLQKYHSYTLSFHQT